jgi:hypothetical protein
LIWRRREEERERKRGREREERMRKIDLEERRGGENRRRE